MNLLNELKNLLQQDARLTANGELLKNQITELALKLDKDLLKLLLSHDGLKAHFFTDVDGIKIFDKEKFMRFVNNKAFLPDSYTTFKNKIGLTVGERYLSENRDLVLSWAYKDCVLEGGQTKEDSKRDEVFWNEILAPDEIDRLLAPKIFTNFKRYDVEGEHILTEWISSENLIIKGNNMLVLGSLIKNFAKKIKLICIDPPYNRANDDFNYNDSFTHSTWLTFMKSRLDLSRKLLHPNGTIFIFCDDNEHAYLKVLMDEIFGRQSFITTVVWRNSDNSNNDAKQFSIDHNYILVYSNNEKWESIHLSRTEDQSRHYKNPDNDPRGPWFDGNPVNSPNPRKNLTYKLEGPNSNMIDPPPNGWRWDQKTMKDKIRTGEIRFTEDGSGIIRRTYLWEQKGLPPSTLWDVVEDNYWVKLKETGHTRQAKYEQKKLFPQYPTSELFSTPKPEKVIEKIIRISTYKDDYVLDYFGGSGTTAAVALKMGRKFLLCEQMDYILDFPLERLKKVVGGEQGGISKTVNWLGGGSFVYCELTQWNEKFVQQILNTNDKSTLRAIWEEMQSRAFLSYRLDLRQFSDSARAFVELSVEDQKRFLMETLDKNALYVNLSEIDDETYGVSEEDKRLNRQFYGI
jgi:adenine-specific DNA-methyltransferase